MPDGSVMYVMAALSLRIFPVSVIFDELNELWQCFLGGYVLYHTFLIFVYKEETVVYSIYPAGNTARATELIADLVQNSRFPERELDKERQVIADEIDSYLDSPADAVYDDFDDLLFAGSPLGHNILGSKTDIAHIDSEQCRRYLHKHYTAQNMVAFYSGPESAARVAATFSRHFDPPIKKRVHAGASEDVCEQRVAVALRREHARQSCPADPSETDERIHAVTADALSAAAATLTDASTLTLGPI